MLPKVGVIVQTIELQTVADTVVRTSFAESHRMGQPQASCDWKRPEEAQETDLYEHQSMEALECASNTCLG